MLMALVDAKFNKTALGDPCFKPDCGDMGSIKRLKEQGLVQRCQSEDCKGKNRWRITPKGRRWLKALSEWTATQR